MAGSAEVAVVFTPRMPSPMENASKGARGITRVFLRVSTRLSPSRKGLFGLCQSGLVLTLYLSAPSVILEPPRFGRMSRILAESNDVKNHGVTGED